jgi:hypothetical protein
MDNLKVLNTNIGASNIVDQDSINDIMCKTLEDLGKLLENHCGPYGKFAMLPPDATNPLAEPVFTTDGINIVNAVTYINPIQELTRKMLAYIGKKIDNAAGDGTTSSMLITTKLLSQLREYLHKNQYVNRKLFLDAYGRFCDNVLEELDHNYSIDIDLSDTDFVHKIAYSQALTSSHGDRELSSLVAELMTTLPKHAWDTIIFRKEIKETDVKFKLEVDDSSYSCNAFILCNQMLNNEVGTTFNSEDSELIVTSSELACTGLEYTQLKKKINDRKPEDRPLVIITGFGRDAKVVSELSELFYTRRKEGVDITIFRVMMQHPVINDLEALYATTGYLRRDMMDTSISFNNIDFKYENETLYIKNLVEYNVDGSHPELEKETSPAKSLVYLIDEFLDDIKNSRAKVYDGSNMADVAKRIASAVKCKAQGYIVIGGSGYDNRAGKDVLVDALAAVKESLSKGITLGGYKSLKKSIKKVYFDGENIESFGLVQNVSDSRGTYLLEKNIAKIFLNAFHSMLELIYIDKAPIPKEQYLDPFTRLGMKLRGKKLPTSRVKELKDYIYGNRDYDRDMTSMDVTTGEVRWFTRDDIMRGSSNIIQPKSIDTEFLKRFGEVAIKFLFTNEVLIPDGVNINQDKDT